MKIGIDSVEVKRIEKIFKTRSNLEKIYSPTELENINNCKHKYERASGYYAVKEAFLKALNIGLNGKIKLNEICVCYTLNNAPKLQISEKIEKTLSEFGFSECEISITHTSQVATAVCVLN